MLRPLLRLRALLVALLVTAAPAAAAERPHIILIMVDDLDEVLLQSMLAAGRLPQLRALFVDRGLDFRHFYVSNPICCPSRATLLTGRYSHNHKALNVMGPSFFSFGLKYWLQDGEQEKQTFPVRLQAAGYRTAHIGKYLNGYGWDTQETYIPPGYDDWQGLIDLSTYRMFDYKLNDNGKLLAYGSRPEEYQTDVLADRAVAFLDTVQTRWPGQPFFLGLFPVAPHVEHILKDDTVTFATRRFLNSIRPAPRHLPLLAQSPAAGGLPDLPPRASFNPVAMPGKSRWMQHQYPLDVIDVEDVHKQFRDRAAAMLAVDDLLGKVAATLAAHDLLKSTYLIFTSDNGWFYGEHRLTQKSLPYEPDTHVPLYVTGPDIAPGTREQLVANIDLMPTILGWAGLTDDSRDGRPLNELLQAPPPPWPRQRLLLEGYNVRATANFLSRPTFAAVRERSRAGDFSYIRWETGHVPAGDLSHYAPKTESFELYDLKTDPEQQISRIPPPPLQARLDGLLDALRTCRGDDCRRLEDQVLPPTDVGELGRLPVNHTLRPAVWQHPALKLIDYALLRQPLPAMLGGLWIVAVNLGAFGFWRRREARWVLGVNALLAASALGLFAVYGYSDALQALVLIAWLPLIPYLHRQRRRADLTGTCRRWLQIETATLAAAAAWASVALLF